MERWNNRVAVVTGASSGIGAAIMLDLVKSGLIVAGLARRVDRVKALKCRVSNDLRSKIHPVKCDVSNDESVAEAFDWVEKNLGGIDVLVNNAGISKFGQIISMDMGDMQEVMQVNVFGVIRCTRRAYKSMKERDFAGHIININSVVGHKVLNIPNMEPVSNIYSASKFALTALIETLSYEFKYAESKVKITSVSPGLTETEFLPEGLRNGLSNMLNAADISQAVLYALGTPENVQIKELMLRRLGEIF